VAECLPSSKIGVKEQVEGFIGEGEFRQEVLEEDGGGTGVVESIVPLAVRMRGVDDTGQLEAVAECAEGEGVKGGPGGPIKVKGVYPGTERMAGEGAEKAFFGAVTVRDEDAIGEQAMNLGPEGEKGRGSREICGSDAVHLLSGPSDLLVRGEKGAEGFAEAVCRGPKRDRDLHGDIGLATTGARGLKVNGCKLALGDGGQERKRGD
jgi:hypothetical protein